MKIKEALEVAKNELKVENPIKEANILLSAFLKKPREWIFLYDDEEIENSDEFISWIKRRADFEPLEYITQSVSFYSKDFFIEKGVLVPRPETEILVDKANLQLQNIKSPKVLEIGVGSGIISIMLALLHEDISITATDISEKALEVARKNALKFGVSEKIEFHHCSFEEGVSGKFDMLVSNPPYIQDNIKLDAHVLCEPHEALFGGEKGHEVLAKLVKIAKGRGIGLICCEMGYDQKEAMEEVFTQEGIREFEFYKDLSSHDRGFIAKF